MNPSPNPVPLACTLTTDDARERAERWRRLLERAAIDRTRIDDGVRVTLRADPDGSAELDALVAAERECCPFLTFTLWPAGEELVLDATGDREAHAIIDELLGAPAA